ncbi:MAG: flagellar basal body L-ring protein FlgH [Gammaproteobacteria bacterium]|nr:MAG: flagellar basal body L-ring protein FlgH [Gammaproteobacteria bacterium]
MAACQQLPVFEPLEENDPRFAPVTTASIIPPKISNGSIYQLGYGVSLFDDHRAKRVGDVLTILLSESTVSSKSAQSNTSKDNSTAVGGATFNGLSVEAAMEGSRSFSGSGASDQSNSLQGTITVTVAEVLANGVLVVRGEKWITLTRGEELLRVSGLIRPADIRPDNTVESSKLGDARIHYSGKGQLAESTGMGWLARFFSGPLFPF